MNKKENSLNLLEAILLYVVLVSFIAVALLSADKFKSSYSLILGAVAFLAASRIFHIRIEMKDGRFGIGIVLVLLAALLFRFSPYLFVLGGQDEGLYVSMSSHIERTGTARIIDGMRESLNDAQKTVYDATNQSGGNAHQPGIAIRDLNKSEYVFPWYPLHPLWMAIFARLFGSDIRVYSLVFFSLVSLISFYLLALELSGGRRYPAYLTALFLAVNPLHAFFSKFPTNEIPALAFASSGLYYLLRYYKRSLEGRDNVFDLVLSAGLMGCLFFVRMNVYIYVVFLYSLSVLTLLFVDDRSVRKRLLSYFLAVLAIFAVSNVYYFYSMPELFRIVWGVFVHSRKALYGAYLIILLLTGVFAAGTVIRENKLFQKIASSLSLQKRTIVFSLFLLTLAATAYHFHAFKAILHMNGLQSLSHTPLFWVALYLSPFGFIACVAAAYHFWKKGDAFQLLLVTFLLVSILYYAVLLPRIINGEPYQYYHARFLLTEIIPFSLLLIALLLDAKRGNKAVNYSVIALMTVFSLFYSGYQLAGREEPDINFYKGIMASTGRNDGLVMTSSDAMTVIRTPLIYYCNLNLMTVKDLNELYRVYIDTLNPKFNALYLLSAELGNDDDALDYVKTVQFKYGCFSNGFHALTIFPAKETGHSVLSPLKSLIPTDYNTGEKTYYLYRLKKLSRTEYFDLNRTRRIIIRDQQDKLVDFYPDGWTNGNGVIKNIEYTIKPQDRFLVIHTFGHHPQGNDIAKLRLRVFVNKRRLTFKRVEQDSFYFDLDRTVDKIREIRIHSSTFNPSLLRINNDNRDLGLYVASIEIR